MKKIDILFDYAKISNKKIEMRNCAYIYQNRETVFNGKSIRNIMNFINTIKETKRNTVMPIVLLIGNVKIEDKLTYIMLEILCYYVASVLRRQIYVSINAKNQISTEGIDSSPLGLLGKIKKDNVHKFMEKFEKEIYMRHYRKVISREKLEDKSLISKLLTEISSYLSVFDVDKKTSMEIAGVITELVDNVSEHTDGDCLIDIDVTKEYFNVEKKDGLYYGLNVVVLNFSECLLGDKIKQKIMNDDILNDRHKKIKEAYSVHKSFFDGERYKEEDFFNVCSFQHHITGRCEFNDTGGTGLTKLISSLEKKSEANQCYMVTGERVIFFRENYLEYNSENWIGFNDENDFLGHKPLGSLIDTCHIYIPGTAYNLNFVMKKENIK